MSKIVLGTVQIGMRYGVSNRNGLMSQSDARDLLETAYDNGCRTLDTAEAYGTSERRLGEIGVERFGVISKLAHLPIDNENLRSYIYDSVKGMIDRVGVKALEAVLLHNARELTALSEEQLKEVRIGFDQLKEDGMIRKCGVSVYTPEDLIACSARFKSDLVQLPCCPLDARWNQSIIVHELRASGVEIHARSVFLQGLLLMPPSDIPKYFNEWHNLLANWHQWLRDMNITPLQACLQLSVNNPLFDKIVVGAQSREELEQQFNCLNAPMPGMLTVPFTTIDHRLLNPSEWIK